MQHAIAAKSAAWHESRTKAQGPRAKDLLWLVGLLVGSLLPAAFSLLHLPLATGARLPFVLVRRAANSSPFKDVSLCAVLNFSFHLAAAIHLNGNFVSSQSQ